MSLTGNLETMGLPEVLQWIATSRKTGTLYLRRAATEKRIVFQHGTVYSSWSNHPRESLGQFLIRDRFVTEEQLFRALQRQEKNGKMSRSGPQLKWKWRRYGPRCCELKVYGSMTTSSI